jgi:hypothetical protein
MSVPDRCSPVRKELAFSVSGLCTWRSRGSLMTSASVLAFATTIVWAAPVLSEPPGQNIQSLPTLSRFAGEPPAQVDRRGIMFPVIEYQGTDGILRVRRGIIAGQQIAPGTVLGLGIFETAHKARGYVGDVPPNMSPPKRSRRAAVGLSWRF